jgi:hypothetical protein
VVDPLVGLLRVDAVRVLIELGGGGDSTSNGAALVDFGLENGEKKE